jgi:hypothetical protein
MEIVWTKLAIITYKEILENLKVRWTKKELRALKELTNDALIKIKNKQIVFSNANKDLEVRKIVLPKNVSLFYKVDNNTIYLITFFNNKMNPESLIDLLNQ